MQNSKENKLKTTKKPRNVQNKIHKQKVSINFKEIITERDPLSIVMLSVVALLGITMFSSNYIFAKEEESYLENKPKEIIGTFWKIQKNKYEYFRWSYQRSKKYGICV